MTTIAEMDPGPAILAPADRLAIAELIARYAWASDERDAEALGNCFEEDGALEVQDAGGKPPTAVQGRAQIVTWVRARHAAEFARGDIRRHISSALAIDAEAEDRAIARSYVHVLVADGTGLRVAAFGTCIDQVARRGGAWRIVRRRVKIDARA